MHIALMPRFLKRCYKIIYSKHGIIIIYAMKWFFITNFINVWQNLFPKKYQKVKLKISNKRLNTNIHSEMKLSTFCRGFTILCVILFQYFTIDLFLLASLTLQSVEMPNHTILCAKGKWWCRHKAAKRLHSGWKRISERNSDA